MSDEPITVRPFNYAAFISELRELNEMARELVRSNQHAPSQVFRQWRHTLQDLITRVNRLGYSVNTKEHSRLFRVKSSIATREENNEAFMRDMHDTWIELDLVIRQYEMYGDPKTWKAANDAPAAVASTTALAAAELEGPVQPRGPTVPKDGITVRWMIDNVTWRGWTAIGGLAALIFGAGAAVGNWSVTQKLGERLSGAAPTLEVKPLPASTSALNASAVDPGTRPEKTASYSRSILGADWQISDRVRSGALFSYDVLAPGRITGIDVPAAADFTLCPNAQCPDKPGLEHVSETKWRIWISNSIYPDVVPEVTPIKVTYVPKP
jgi:hypothetical protein